MIGRCLATGLVVLMLAAPSSRAADRPYAVESASIGLTLADGDRYASWVRAGAVRVLDETTGAVSSYPLPAECRPPGALGDGRVATICGQEFRLLDLATGAWTTLPSTEASQGLFAADSVSVDGVGRAWISVTVEVGYHAPVFPAWIERATGNVVSREPRDLHLHADLDAPELWTPLCAPLMRRKNPDWDPIDAYGSPYIAPTLIGTRALDFRGDALVLRRCRRSKMRVITRSRHWRKAWFGAARVSWIDQDGLRALGGDERGRGRLRTFDAVTGRVRSWTVPGGVNPNLWVVHTRRHVFLDKLTGSYAAHRYAVDL